MKKQQKILVLGGDGYLGWPTAMYFSRRGNEVAVIDNFNKRKWERQIGVVPLVPILPLDKRVALWMEITGSVITPYVGDLKDSRFVRRVLKSFQPDVIIHYGEQPSAPFSMMNTVRAVETQVNNVVGTLNVIYAMHQIVPDAHLVKLGTMGEYGTPNIAIEEGWLDVTHKGRSDRVLYPKKPGSFYHLSKVHDSHNLEFACRVWGLRVTDLNQGVVYGIETEETGLATGLQTSFHYDAIFGTALNRFCVQAVTGVSITPYGKGGQRRGYLNIMDTLQCVELAALNPASQGEFRVFNQFTEVFSVNELAELVRNAAKDVGISASIRHIKNPRKEDEEHYYEPVHTALPKLGLKPQLLSSTLVESMLGKIIEHKDAIRKTSIKPRVSWMK